MIRLSSVPLALVIVIALAACQVGTTGPAEIGSGTSKTEDRTVPAFSGVSAEATIIAEVTVGSPASVAVTADDNLLDNVQTSVAGSVLELRLTGNLSIRTPVRVRIVMPAVSELNAESSAEVRAAGVDAQSLRVRSESSGRVSATGRATSLDIRGTSAGQIELGELDAASATVALESAAMARLHVSQSVEGSVAGAAVLTVAGSPSSMKVTTASAGQVVSE